MSQTPTFLIRQPGTSYSLVHRRDASRYQPCRTPPIPQLVSNFSHETAMADHSTCLPLTRQSVHKAHKRIEPYIHRTPVATCSTIDKLASTSSTGSNIKHLSRYRRTDLFKYLCLLMRDGKLDSTSSYASCLWACMHGQSTRSLRARYLIGEGSMLRRRSWFSSFGLKVGSLPDLHGTSSLTPTRR